MMTLLANAGIPMLFWQLPLAVVALFPVVIIESLIAWPLLRRPLAPVAARVFLANAFSTFIGVPLAWFFMVVVAIASGGGGSVAFNTPWEAFHSIVLGAAWLPPDRDHLHWLIPAATLVLLVPYFFVSVALERWMMLRRWQDLPRQRVAGAVWLGNGLTYLAFAAWAGYRLLHALP